MDPDELGALQNQCVQYAEAYPYGPVFAMV